MRLRTGVPVAREGGTRQAAQPGWTFTFLYRTVSAVPLPPMDVPLDIGAYKRMLLVEPIVEPVSD